MKHFFKYIGYTCSVFLLLACDPIENRLDLGATITESELNITAVPLIVDGKRSNKVIVQNNSPVLSFWKFSTGTSRKSVDTLLMVIQGENKIVFTGLNPDGTKISKNLSVMVDQLSFPVPPEWALLTGGKEKTWKWDETKPAVWGSAGYLIHFAPAWWSLKEENMNDHGAGEGIGATMRLALEDAVLTKIKSTGEKEVGSFSFDMSKTIKSEDGKIWSYGKFKTSGTSILVGKSPDEGNMPVHEFDILTINEKELVLAYAPAGTAVWGNAYFWVFRAVN